jgi:benzoate membrane transport protein
LFSQNALRQLIPAVGASIPIIILFITVVSIPLSAAQTLRLTATETSAWIWSLYGLPGLISLGLVLYYRQPLLLTGNIFAIIFLATLDDQTSYPALVGASILAGTIVVLLGAFGLTGRLSAWIPAPIMLGLVAGAVLPYVIGVFTEMGDEPVIVGGTLFAFLLGSRYLRGRLPPILPALVVGLVVTGLTGRFGSLPDAWAFSVPAITLPSFSLETVITATPILVVLMTLQANVPSIIYLRGQGYQPPERALNVVSGAGTLFGSLLGPTAVSIPVLLTPLASGPDAGRRNNRHWSVYLAAASLVVIAIVAGAAVELTTIIPSSLLRALAGLSLVGVLGNSLRQISRGPMQLGPLFTFIVTLSPVSFFGLGRFFWALVIGMGVSLLLEAKQMTALRAEAAD